MTIRSKAITFVSLSALVPCVLAAVLLVLADRALWAFLVCVPGIIWALFLAWVLGRTHRRVLQELTARARDVVSGNLTAFRVSDDTHRAFPAYAEQLAAVGTALEARFEEVRQQVAEQAQEIERMTQHVAEAKHEQDRMSTVLMEREYTMVQLKRSLKELQRRCGEEMVLPEATTVPTEHDAAEMLHDKAAMLNVLEDLEEEKSLLATEKAKDEAILKSIGDGLMVVDVRGRITFLNEIAKELLGVSFVDPSTNMSVVLKGIRDAKSEAEVSLETLPLAQAVQGKSVEKQDLLIRTPDAPDGCYISMTATPIMVSGLPMGAVATFRDMTKEREIDRAKTEFVSLASHQLRTPLSTINWYAEMLLAGDAGELNDEQRTYLDEVYQGNQRMVDLINSLLNVSRLELGTFSVDPEDTDVVALAQSVLNEQAPQVKERDIQLSATLDPSTPHLYADPKLLRMVLQNLISNAIKYTPIGGSVSVKVEPSGDAISMRVADTGLGIPKEDQGRIFSKLFRATNARESDTDGTGLGLYIVRSVVEHSDGTIRFESEEGKGTVFYVELPLRGMTKREGTRTLS